MTNCKNCGAPLEGEKCPYCGTVYRGNYQNADTESVRYYDGQEVLVCIDLSTKYTTLIDAEVRREAMRKGEVLRKGE